MKVLDMPLSNLMLRNIPNALTITRLFLIIPFIVMLHHQEYVCAFAIFILAGLTDCMDGWLARSFGWQSPFGTFIDPVADKLLITTSFISLALIAKLPWWLVFLVFLRDLTISVGVIAWFAFITQKPQLRATYISKLNTVMQLLLVTVSLFELAFVDSSSTLHKFLIFCIAITTAISFVDYVWTWGRKAYICSKMQK